MEEYIVSARKYRPDSFETLIGQDNIARTLKNSISRGQLAHAYLFCGPRGVGKTTTARIFAKMINCSNPLPGGEPCGECESCRSFAEGRSYCIFEMDAASNNGVDAIKDLIDKVRIAPQVGKYSVYIIDEVHMLSAAAFNAFLKTLEEPPEYAIFILATTEKHKILPTILSRCQTYDFNRISVGDIVRNLKMVAEKESIKIDDDSLHVIALKADGAMRDALTIFDQSVAFCGNDIKYADIIRNLNVIDYEYSFNFVNWFLSGDYSSAMRTFDEVLSKGFDALHFISTLSAHLRDLMVAKAGGIDSLMELSDSLKERYRAQAASCSEKFLFDALGLTTACEQQYKAAINPRLHIEFCLMRLCFLNRATAPAAPAPAPAAPAPAPAAPAATPAPDPAPTAKPEQAPAKKPAFSSGLSLKSVVSSTDTVEKQNDGALLDAMPTDEAIKSGWEKLCKLSESNVRLYNGLTTAKLGIVEENGFKVVTYYVVNAALKDWFNSMNSRMENRLRELIGTAKVSFKPDVQAMDPAENKAVTIEDKAKEMLEKNPKVGEIVKDLGLDIK